MTDRARGELTPEELDDLLRVAEESVHRAVTGRRWRPEPQAHR